MNRAIVFMNPVPSKSPQISCFKFLKVIAPCFSDITLISSSVDDTDDARVININYNKQKNPILRALGFVLFQFKLIIKSLSIVKKGDTVFFWIGDKMFAPMLVCKLKRVKTYFFHYTIPTLEYNTRKARTTVKGQNFMAKMADFVCAESPSAITDRGVGIDDKTKIIHLYVDDLKGADVKENKIGMLCRLAPEKCVLQSIEAFAEFHRIHPEFTLDIVGDGMLYNECKEMIAQLDAESYITLYGWMLHEELFKIMPSWKLLLFPTKTEGLPNSVLESMSMTTPALASTAGGLKDLIVDKENGYLLKNEEVDTIFNALCDIVEGGTIKEVSKRAKETVNDKFTLINAQENFKSQMGF